jgi:intein/homing endonuclease
VELAIKVTPVFERTLNAISETVKNPKNELERIARYRFIVHQGGARCFDGSQKVITNAGTKRIKEITPNDMVLSYNELTGENEYKRVKELFVMENTKKAYKVRLKNGETIIATGDHKFWSNGEWVELQEILSKSNNKTNGNMETNTRI